ncbi:glycosyltransferase [Eggerthella sp. YY7918]|uniref:glycosyltransferase n=1 Tax=Eggerthella sp. (strain YY7918) TaxID=502558 RepID=UPI0002171127|nr:glycosyltransferase [Eggerthella sp. YY7918]BAK44101.1 hypothetical protein EGYY_09120 [Eggerthella sp. YY7918]
MSSPSISVIVPVYNVEKYLQSCIDSLVNQTFKEIEFIFVNDSSPDNSLELLYKNERQYPNLIQVINSKENMRQGGARNLGLRAARGKYIGFVDPDDLIAPDMYEVLYEAIREQGSDVAFVQHTSVHEKSGLSHIRDTNEVKKPLIEWSDKLIALNNKTLNDAMRADLMCYPIGGVWCGLWKKALIMDNKVFFPEHMRYEDNYWGALVKCYVSKVAFVNSIKYYYRLNPNSTTHLKNASHHFDRLLIENMLLDEVKRRNLFYRYHEAWEYIYTFRYAFNSYWLFLTQFDSPPLGEMKRTMDDLRTVFPKWTHNKYYKEQTAKMERVINALLVRFPVQIAKAYPVYKQIRYK